MPTAPQTSSASPSKPSPAPVAAPTPAPTNVASLTRQPSVTRNTSATATVPARQTTPIVTSSATTSTATTSTAHTATPVIAAPVPATGTIAPAVAKPALTAATAAPVVAPPSALPPLASAPGPAQAAAAAPAPSLLLAPALAALAALAAPDAATDAQATTTRRLLSAGAAAGLAAVRSPEHGDRRPRAPPHRPRRGRDRDRSDLGGTHRRQATLGDPPRRRHAQAAFRTAPRRRRRRCRRRFRRRELRHVVRTPLRLRSLPRDGASPSSHLPVRAGAPRRRAPSGPARLSLLEGLNPRPRAFAAGRARRIPLRRRRHDDTPVCLRQQDTNDQPRRRRARARVAGRRTCRAGPLRGLDRITAARRDRAGERRLGRSALRRRGHGLASERARAPPATNPRSPGTRCRPSRSRRPLRAVDGGRRPPFTGALRAHGRRDRRTEDTARPRPDRRPQECRARRNSKSWWRSSRHASPGHRQPVGLAVWPDRTTRFTASAHGARARISEAGRHACPTRGRATRRAGVGRRSRRRTAPSSAGS